jgi:multicomponent Na+:H+ antiporter subunit B
MRNLASLLFAAGLAFFLLVIAAQFNLGEAPMLVGESILKKAPDVTGAANIVTSVVLGYRGIDTLGEIAILFTASLAAGLVLGRRRPEASRDPDSGAVLQTGAHLLFPLLLLVGFYIIFHGHLTPGGGFQGGVILAAAFFLPLLARPRTSISHSGLALVEGLAGAGFILIGLAALFQGKEFLQPLLDTGTLGMLVSGGTLPLLYLAVGLKVGAELAGLLAHIADAEVDE